MGISWFFLVLWHLLQFTTPFFWRARSVWRERSMGSERMESLWWQTYQTWHFTTAIIPTMVSPHLNEMMTWQPLPPSLRCMTFPRQISFFVLFKGSSSSFFPFVFSSLSPPFFLSQHSWSPPPPPPYFLHSAWRNKGTTFLHQKPNLARSRSQVSSLFPSWRRFLACNSSSFSIRSASFIRPLLLLTPFFTSSSPLSPPLIV